MGLALLADKLPAARAAEWGLIWACVADGEFRAHVDALAARLAAMPTKALVRDALEATKGYVGASGKVNMSPTDHMGLDLSAFRLVEIKAGDWALLGSK